MSIEQQFSLCNLDHTRNTIKIKCDTTAQRSQLHQLQCKNHTADALIFEKETLFCMTFWLALAWLTVIICAIQMVHHKLAHGSAIAVTITNPC